jgi:hypothetical protein
MLGVLSRQAVTRVASTGKSGEANPSGVIGSVLPEARSTFAILRRSQPQVAGLNAPDEDPLAGAATGSVFRSVVLE